MKKKISLFLVFTMLVAMLTACGSTTTDAQYDVDAAAKYVKNLYKDTDGAEKASDYTLVNKVKVGTDTYTVDWTANVTSGSQDDVKLVVNTDDVTVDVNEKASTECKYTLTATITAPDKTTATYSVNHVIPAYKQFSWADYVAAADDATVVVTGVVTGLISKSKGASSNCIYFQDTDGGYYIYAMSSDPIADLGIKEGYTINVTGIRDTYSGTYEITSASVEIADTTTSVPAAADYTDIYTKAADLKDATLVEKQSFYVTLKGVELTGQGSDTTYYNFKLGDKESYIRLSSSTCPLSSDEQTTFKNKYLANVGNVCDVTGIITLYSGAFYLTPVSADCITNIQAVEKTDAEKVAFEAKAVTFSTKYSAATTITLPTAGTNYSDVAFTWAINENDAATLADGVVTIVLPKQDTAVTLTATVTCGAETQTVEYTFTVEAPSDDMCEAEVLSKAAALEQGESMSGTQVLRGKITEINTAYDASYGNITVTIDVNGTAIQCFRLVGGEDLAVGDEITVTGTLTNYKGTIEFGKGCTYSKDMTVEEAKEAVVLAKAAALEQGESMTGTQVLQGKITEINTAYSADYGNITVTIDVQGTAIQCFRLVGGEDLAVDDTITVTGTLTNYKGTIEFAKGCTYSKTQTIAEAKDAVVMAKAYALAENEEMSGIQELTGTITEINTAYSADYGNITVTIDVQGQTIQCFRLVGGEDLAVGDTITVTGYIKNYKGTVEFNSKCTYTK